MSDYQTAQDIYDALSAPFPSELIDWRVGSTTNDKTKGMALAYIDARTVMDRLDFVCGVDGWQCDYSQTGAASIVCNLRIRMPDGTWIAKADGAGQTDYEAEKGMLSDAFKRAAVRFGVGRYLYDLDSPWVDIEQKGRTYVIKPEAKPRLEEVHEKAAIKLGWGGSDARTYANAVRLVDAAVKSFVRQPDEAQTFKASNEAVFKALPKDARNRIYETLDRVGAPA